jgi:hypothetical protein
MAWFGRDDWGRNGGLRVQRELDTRALEMAAAVRADHDTHVRECRERYLDTKHSLDTIQESIANVGRERQESSRRLYGMMWKTAASTIGLLLAIIGYLLTHSAPWETLFKMGS